MKYGHFDDSAREYVIETPATPLPWINYLGNEDFFSLISNTGGGYSFYKDAKLRRITRYRYNNVPADNGSRCYYLSLMDSNAANARPVETWSPTFLPSKTPLDSYKCRQGIGYTVFEASKRGIESRLTAFVPLHTNAEINRLDVTNTTGKPVVVDVTGCVEWCLWNAVDDSSNFQRNLSTGEVEIERQTDATLLYHKTEFKERRTTTRSTPSTRLSPASTPAATSSSANSTAGTPRRPPPRARPTTPWPTAGIRSPRTAYAWNSSPARPSRWSSRSDTSRSPRTRSGRIPMIPPRSASSTRSRRTSCSAASPPSNRSRPR